MFVTWIHVVSLTLILSRSFIYAHKNSGDQGELCVCTEETVYDSFDDDLPTTNEDWLKKFPPGSTPKDGQTQPILNLGSKPQESSKTPPIETKHEQPPPKQQPPPKEEHHEPVQQQPPPSNTGKPSTGEGGTIGKAPAGTGDTAGGAALPKINQESTGKATYYGGNIDGGNCGMRGYTLPEGYGGVAMSSVTWASSLACGTCVEVAYKGKSIRLMVLDQCPECGLGHFDLFEKDFLKIAPQKLGVIPDLKYKVINCALSRSITYVFKEKNAYYFAVQTWDANFPIVKFEVSADNGKSFKNLYKDGSSGFWLAGGGLGLGPFLFRVTAEDGQVLTQGPFMMDDQPHKQADGNFN